MGAGITSALILYTGFRFVELLIAQEDSRFLKSGFFQNYDLKSRIRLNLTLWGLLTAVFIANFARKKEWIGGDAVYIVFAAAVVVFLVVYAIVRKTGVYGE